MNTVKIPPETPAAGGAVPIVFSMNDSYAPYAGVAIQSIIMNADPRNAYRIYVLHTAVSEKHIRELESMTTENVAVRCLNIERLMSRFQTPLPIRDYVTEETYYRFLIPEIPELASCTRVIYLDCDLIVNADIVGIIPPDMGNHLIAGVRDHCMMEKSRRERLETNCGLDAARYVNAGVLVFNVSRWIQENTLQKCLDFMKSTPPENLEYMDQDVLNAVCRDRIAYLDESWNYYTGLYLGNAEIVARCRPIVDRIGDGFRILHFTRSQKPWRYMDHPYFRHFWKHAGRSPFLEEIIRTNLCSRDELEKNAVFLRVGRAVTWLPRKLSGGVRCFRDHGAGYTVRRMLYHIGLWKDEEMV